MREQVDDFFADPVAKVVLLWIGTNIHERQHGNGCSARWDCGTDLLRLVPQLWIQPAKDRDVTAGPQSDQDSVISSRAFVIFLQLGSEAASLNPDNGVNVRIVLGRAVENLHCYRELFQTAEISLNSPIHDVLEEPAQASRGHEARAIYDPR